MKCQAVESVSEAGWLSSQREIVLGSSREEEAGFLHHLYAIATPGFSFGMSWFSLVPIA